MNTIRSQRHDFNLHLHAIAGLISGGEYEECGEYVRKLVEDAAAVNDIMPVADAVVGSMLYNMREQARRKGSDIFYHITYDMEDIVCNGFECNKIIGNLLQNAIDAMHSTEDLAFGIRASIFKRRGCTVICVENRFTGDPNTIARVFEPGWSTKRGHEGIGLAMVLRTVEQYGGRVYPEFEEDLIRFVVTIPNRVRFE
ncbi:MAG: GHKL domain-containing protein [Oscillospiraceae bacterium]|nr:GHKL domain-containing protein [Oscillospiraceae bacterium]